MGWKRRLFSLVVAASLAAPLPVIGGAAPAAAYRVAQTVPLESGRGTLQIVEDSRITPDMAQAMWGVATDPALVFGDDSPLARQFRGRPALPAKLRLRDAQGRIAAERIIEAESPLARIEARKLGGAFLVSTDDSAGMGSYSGIRTALFLIAAGAIEPVDAIDATGTGHRIILSRTLKAAWRMAGTATAPEITEVRCDPDWDRAKPGEDVIPFVISLRRYWMAGGRWRSAIRKEPGFWESDRDFPEASAFPPLNEH